MIILVNQKTLFHSIKATVVAFFYIIEIGAIIENAEVILQDVVAKGDAQQQFDAQQLLDNIS
ncbi:hypothetical protein A3Q34_04600 [Colwellia sp. PAMC 20917]|nr:hypothetical protein A3Q34_04600 [Colwellia sp. PAMC 20917]